jgi:hypothetical protein
LLSSPIMIDCPCHLIVYENVIPRIRGSEDRQKR